MDVSLYLEMGISDVLLSGQETCGGRRVLADVDVFGFRFADGKFVASDGDFNGVSQRRHFADKELRAFGYSHIHDASFDGACP